MTIDLFTPIVPQERWHPNFRRIVEHGLDEERAVLRAWADGFVDRDGKFVQEFQKTFNSGFWELYVHAVLRESRCELDLRHAAPDFVIEGGPFGRLVAECVVALNPEAGLPEWVTQDIAAPRVRETLLDLAVLRLSQAIAEKIRKWREAYSLLPQCVGRPYVICVAPFEQPGGHQQGTEAIDRVLFGGPRPIFEPDAIGKARVVGHSRFDKVFKPSGAEVQLGVLLDPNVSFVSGVVFSSLATWSKVSALAARRYDTHFVFQHIRYWSNRGLVVKGTPKEKYRETLVDGAHLFLNPNATHPLDADAWKARGFGVHRHQTDGTFSDVPEGVLIGRRAYRIGHVRMAPHAAPPGAKEHAAVRPPDGVLFGGPSRVPGVDEIYVMLHRGWTVVIGRHADGDVWQSRFRPGTFLSVEQFFTNGPEGEGASPLRPERALLIEETKRYLDRVIDSKHDEDDGPE